MEQIVLQGESRSETGKGVARRLRREGRIPAVIYGHSEPVHLSVAAREFHKAFHTISESTIFALEVGSAKKEVLIKDYVEDITTGAIMHLDFFEIERGKKLRTHVSIELTGSSIGVREGGILDHSLYELEIECLPRDIPEKVTVDVTTLKKDEVIHVSDLDISPAVRVLTHPEQTIVSVVTPRAEAVDTDEEDGGATESTEARDDD